MARKFSQSRAVPRNKIDRNKSSCTLVQSRGLQLQYLLYTWLPIGEDYHELHWITKDYHGLPIFLKDYHVLPRITTHYVGLPRISMENHGLPWILPRCCSVLLLGVYWRFFFQTCVGTTGMQTSLIGKINLQFDNFHKPLLKPSNEALGFCIESHKKACSHN